MSTGTSASLWLTLLSVVLSVSGQINITAEPGQTVSLPCKALNNEPVTVVEWRRTDMKEDEYVLLYRDDQLDPENQNPSYKNRVDLQDRQMKDGDVSLILKDVTTDDSGTYECYINQREKNIIKKFLDPISIIRLDVVSSGHTSGHKEDGGDKEGGDKEGLSQGHLGLIVGVVVVVVSLVVAVSLITVRNRKKKSSPPSSPSLVPPVESSDHLLA
ncbi:myelin-oligodendrocyte glycoprotein-like isoform X3 [Mugil cephalus]|uniref:myelin-oligodendrocyte glycoprotein-like isoform X2 n=1 Tax=Mugil cephalus TaxID=48193 RepID=UPI001FB5F2E4|nr:myelin-oligodendrocyte glycoprotein-like isoform X2 [Mugil cephalus]XP_047443620.1 myelin-oligodendrocyte glycoprotein-like isoform X3 [Mugil cephalus]